MLRPAAQTATRLGLVLDPTVTADCRRAVSGRTAGAHLSLPVH